ncbi:hypothetical protein ACFXTH_035774 [Malus domestica]
MEAARSPAKGDGMVVGGGVFGMRLTERGGDTGPGKKQGRRRVFGYGFKMKVGCLVNKTTSIWGEFKRQVFYYYWTMSLGHCFGY